MTVTLMHTLIWATFGHAPAWVLRNPVYRSVQKRMRSHFFGSRRPDSLQPQRATLVGRYLNLEPPIGRERWEESRSRCSALQRLPGRIRYRRLGQFLLLYQLLTHPDHLAQVRQEFETLSRDSSGPVAPAKQKYLRAAFLEAVRLNPPGTAVLRVADRDFEFAGYSIRKGDEVLVVIASDHLNPEVFERPSEFDPTRYFAPQSGPLRRRVLPFGSGSRPLHRRRTRRAGGRRDGFLLGEQLRPAGRARPAKGARGGPALHAARRPAGQGARSPLKVFRRPPANMSSEHGSAQTTTENAAFLCMRHHVRACRNACSRYVMAPSGHRAKRKAPSPFAKCPTSLVAGARFALRIMQSNVAEWTTVHGAVRFPIS